MYPPVYVLDTSYLLELYKVPNCHDPDFANRLKDRFKAEIKASALFFVPFPVLFEWANHIANIPNQHFRTEQANKLHQEVEACISERDNAPVWRIWGADEQTVERFVERLHAWTEAYASKYAGQKIGLTDTTIIHAALDIKHKFSARKVHIWTKDSKRKKDYNQRPLKEHEPDVEPEPLID